MYVSISYEDEKGNKKLVDCGSSPHSYERQRCFGYCELRKFNPRTNYDRKDNLMIGNYRKFHLVKNGMSKDQALSICRNKNRIKPLYVVVKEGEWHTIVRSDSLPPSYTVKNKNLFEDHTYILAGDVEILRESICDINDSRFTSKDCLTCERPICKYNVYKFNGMR